MQYSILEITKLRISQYLKFRSKWDVLPAVTANELAGKHRSPEQSKANTLLEETLLVLSNKQITGDQG